jgi:Tol biopolymer transport system component
MRNLRIPIIVVAAAAAVVSSGSLAALGDSHPIAFADRHTVFTIDPSGGAKTRVATARDDIRAVAWSTLHDQLAYGVRNHVWVTGATGGSPTEVAELRTGFVVEGVAWSPTDQRIAIQATRKVAHSGRFPRFCSSTWTVSSSGGSVNLIREHQEPGNGITWSPNGRWLALGVEGYNMSTPCSRKHPQYGLMRMHPDGSHLQDLHAGFARSPDWSPGGKRIVFDDWRHACHACGQVWVMSSNGRHQHKILGHGLGAQFYEPRWSPDGEEITYVHNDLRSGNEELWTMNDEGRQRHRIFTDGGIRASIWPDW